MAELSRILHVVSTIMLAIGFLGAGAYVVDVNFGSTDGGANIGLGIIVMFSLVAGALGLVLAVVALVAGVLGPRVTPQR